MRSTKSISKFQILKNHASQMRDFLLDLIFPLNCLSCKQEDTLICSNCLDAIAINKNFYCPACKKDNEKGHVCHSCQTKSEIDGLWISSHYASPTIKKSIKRYKYYFQKELATPLAQVMIKFIEENKLKDSAILKNADYLVPVPLHWRRQNFRGFNQAELISQNLNTYLNTYLNKYLKRIKNNKAQAKLSKEKRLANVENIFKYQGQSLVNKNIILIDDVTSTNSTLNECAKVLKDNGAKSVWGFVIASN